MPQLDPSSFTSQAFWLLTCFISFCLLISIFITPRLNKVLEERDNIVNKHLAEAKKYNDSASKIYSEYEKAINETKEKANKDFESSMEELKIFVNEKKASLQKELEKANKETEKTLQNVKKESLLDINNIAIDLAFEISQKLGLKNISKETLKNTAVNKEV